MTLPAQDRIEAVYDADVVAGALDRKHHVAFSAIQSILERKLSAIRLTLLPMRVLET